MLIHARQARHLAGGASIILAALLLMAGFVYWESVGYFTRQIDRALLADAQSLLDGPRPTLEARLEDGLQRDQLQGKAFALFRTGGERLAGNVPSLPADLSAPSGPLTTTLPYRRDGRDRVGAVRVLVRQVSSGETLVVGRSAETLGEISEILTHALLAAFLPTLIIAGIGLAVVRRASLKRVEAVRTACQTIMRGHLDQRLPTQGDRDEIDRLSIIVNEMLDEIERLLSQVRQAGEAIAHDLRTPLTRMQSRLERSIRPVPEGSPFRDDIERVLGEIDGVFAIIAALLRISELEHSRQRGSFKDVDLVEIGRTLAEFYEPVAEEAGLGFDLVTGPVPPVQGDPDLLFEAAANLVENALKFTPPGGHVSITIGDKGQPRIRVADTGPGIPPDERDNVIRRFHRLDQSRHSPGHGLGLPLVATICRLHDGRLTLSERQGGGCSAMIDLTAATLPNQ